MGARRTREEWAALIRQVEARGESPRSFCAKRRIRLETFEWWRWQLRRNGAAKKKRSARKNAAAGAQPSIRLIPVDVPVTTTGAPTYIELSIANMNLRIEVGTSVSYIGELVDALRSRC
jgi:hypothetical protein